MNATYSKKSIECLITEKGMKRNFVADKLGISYKTFLKKLKNPELFSVEQMSEISKILGVKIVNIDFGISFF